MVKPVRIDYMSKNIHLTKHKVAIDDNNVRSESLSGGSKVKKEFEELVTMLDLPSVEDTLFKGE